MTKATVQEKLKESVENVKMELFNAEALTGQTVANTLAAEWESFMTDHLEAIEKFGKTWIKTAITSAEKGIDTAITKYKKLHADLQKKEGKPLPGNAVDPAKQAYHDKQIKAMDIKKAIVAKKQKEEQALTTKINAQEKALITLDALINKTKGKPQKDVLRAQRKVKVKALNADKVDRMDIQQELGKTTRQVQEMFSGSVKDIIANLEKDKATLAKFSTLQKTLQMPTAV
jgi:hypothetical protein